MKLGEAYSFCPVVVRSEVYSMFSYFTQDEYYRYLGFSKKKE
jgi:hypothetical protein